MISFLKEHGDRPRVGYVNGLVSLGLDSFRNETFDACATRTLGSNFFQFFDPNESVGSEIWTADSESETPSAPTTPYFNQQILTNPMEIRGL